MIYLVTLNPSIDYHMNLDQIELGHSNISQNEYVQIGGKGINVGILLNNLKTSSTLIGFIGGFTGAYITEELLVYEHISNSMTKTENITRINVKLKAQEETEINGVGKEVSIDELNEFEKFLDEIKEDDYVVVTGRIAKGLPHDYYIKLAEKVKAKNAELIIDIASKELLEMCQYEPLLIKPNLAELGIIFNTEIKDENAIINYANKLIELGAKNCIVSNGAKGSYLFTKDKMYKANAPEGILVNSVGAGDSMVGGFVNEYSKSQNIEEAYKMAVACGSATAFSKGIANEEMIKIVYEKVKVK